MATNKNITIGSTISESSKCSGTTYASNYYIIVQVTLNSIDEVNAIANVKAECILKSTNYTAWASDSCSFSISVDGTVKNSVSASSGGNGDKSTSTKPYAEWEGDIPYNSDGNLTVEFKAAVSGGDIAYAPGSGSTTMNVTFPYVARQSSITSVSGNYLGSAVTVAIDRKNSAFVHKVEYSFAGSSYTTATSTGGTSVSFTPALTLASNIPNSTSGVLTVKVTTLNGTTQVGSPVSTTLSLALPTSVKPTFTSITARPSSTNTTVNGWGVYVKGYSQAVLTINGAAGVYGSTIKSYSITGGGFSGSSSSLTTGVLNSTGTITFTGTITDSRNRTATNTVSITVLDYTKPSIDVTAYRCDSLGTATSSGTYLRVTATYSYASVSSKNSVSSRSVSCNDVSNTTFTSGTAFTLAANVSAASTYVLTATVKDAVGNSATKTINILTDSRVLNITKDKDGIAFGGFATNNKMTCYYPASFPQGLTGNVSGNATTATSLSGLTATVAELNYCDGVTSSIQTQLNGKAASGHGHSNYLPTSYGGKNVDGSYDGGLYGLQSGSSNCPSGSQYGVLLALPYRQLSGNSKPDFGAQIFIPNGDDSSSPNSMFYRTSLADSWNGWQTVLTNNNLKNYSKPAASARGSANTLSLSAGTATQLTLDTWVARTDTSFSFSGGGIKCPYAGTVIICGNIYYNSNGGGRGVYIKKGSGEVLATYGFQANMAGCATSGVAIISVAAGDVLYINARSTTATSCVPNNSATYLSVAYI